MIRRFFNLTLVIALTFTVAFAQQPSASTPSVDRLRQVIAYLASDALEGRRTGTPGANDAAHYIAGEFNRVGLRPGLQMTRPARTRGENQARYLQPFPYVASVEFGNDNLLYVNPGKADDIAQFKVGDDWMPLGFSSNCSIKSAEYLFVGYGITAAELKYDSLGRRRRTELPSLYQAPLMAITHMESLRVMKTRDGRQLPRAMREQRPCSSSRKKRVSKTTGSRGCTTTIVPATQACPWQSFRGGSRRNSSAVTQEMWFRYWLRPRRLGQIQAF